ncbi:MAG TPA: hypothetical protein P5081_02205 [Phycisphaerae bacterium]|nr:hypothetical protein [Phycisphaerae bacterium]HRW51669.1 hypothetical protein [Phycisphaerae bacterium]
MCTVSYPDFDDVSPNGRFLLEARSPHNGTILHRDGSPATDSEFGYKYAQEQSGFRYRLHDTQTGQVLWERWQEEGSPHEAYVSDQGWCVIRTHGFAPQLFAVNPEGKVALRVLICNRDAHIRLVPSAFDEPMYEWPAEHLEESTAGSFWVNDAWPCFFDFEGCHRFSIRAWWGDRVVINLDSATLLTFQQQTAPDLAAAIRTVERDSCREFLIHQTPMAVRRFSELTDGKPENQDDWRLIERLHAAIRLLGVYRIDGLADTLRALESLELPCHASPCTNALPQNVLMGQRLRELVQETLRRMNEQPLGFATYHFTDYEGQRLPAPERIIDRHARTQRVTSDMTAEQVLALLGSPDDIRQRRNSLAKPGTYAEWPEYWEYDHLMDGQWETFRIVWKQVSRLNAVITEIDRYPSTWAMGGDRVAAVVPS